MSAAKELRAHGLDVLVLEARDRVGGRTLTKVGDVGGEFWVDLGGSYVGPTQNTVLNLIDELGLETYLVDDSLDIAYLRANEARRQPHRRAQAAASPAGSPPSRAELPQDSIERRARFSPLADPPFGNLLHWLDYVHMVRLIDSYGEQIPVRAPWLAAKAREWDSKTFKQFVDENTWTKRVRGYFNHIFVTIDVCCDAQEVSMLWFLWYVRQCGGYGRTISTTNGGQERKIKRGTQQLSEGIKRLIEGPAAANGGKQQQQQQRRVYLNKPVCRIDQSAGPFVLVQTLDGSQYKADHVICAMPPHLLLKMHHEPALPSGKNLLAQRSPMGQVAKVILYYERPFWKEHGFSGCFLIDAQDRRLHPVVLSLDETKHDGSHPAVIGFTAASGWYEMRDKSNQETGKVVAASYASATGLREFLDFKRVERTDWTGEQYSGGCYTSTHTLNTLTKYGPYLRQPFGRIHYAGTETATKWSGYMEGALSAGKRAAREILAKLGRIHEDLVWLEEPDSVTVPPRPFEYPASHRRAPTIDTCVALLSVVGLLTFATAVVWRRLSSNH